MPEHLAVVHGHFYQPPRENPWLETIPREPTAAPFHDWNERITAECYAANASARRLDDTGRIAEIADNYRRISFNFGPTLIGYLERAAPEVYAAILAADREATARRWGHGNAVAQAYNHAILPLATARDKTTQVRWGLADFAHRFGRAAEGMWLPETAVDVPTLETLAAEGVQLTVLAPHQASRVRPLEAADARKPSRKAWRDVSDGSIDTRRAYLCRLPSGRSIALFFYDGALARGVAFDGLLHSGDAFGDRIAAAFDSRAEAQLVHLATDGESYGHHHRFGEMALAAALARLAQRGIATTSYAAFLAAHPPAYEVEIVERTSWSCVHGIERWRADCGCRSGDHEGWTQRWRVGLRAALDALAASLDRWYEEQAGALVGDPWALRDDMGAILPDEARRGLRELLEGRAGRKLADRDAAALARLLGVQRARLLMFTSCGWFFDELTGIEGTQVLRYAARAVQLATEAGFAPPEDFLDALATAHSNLPGRVSGADYFRDRVLAEAITPRRLAVAGAIERLVGVEPGVIRKPPIAIDVEPWLERSSSGVGAGEGAAVSRATLGMGQLLLARVRVSDARTLDERGFVVAATRHGSLDVTCAARPALGAGAAREADRELVATLEQAFERRAYGRLVAEIARHFGGDFFGLDVLGLASRAAFFPAIVADLEALVASRLVELAPLARAIEHEASDVGAEVPSAIAALLEAAESLGNGEPPRTDLVGLLRRLESALLLAPRQAARDRAEGPEPACGSGPGSAAEIVERAVVLLRLRAASSRPFPLEPAQDLFWWRILTRPGLASETLASIDALREGLGFSRDAIAAAAREGPFGALRRVVAEEQGAAQRRP